LIYIYIFDLEKGVTLRTPSRQQLQNLSLSKLQQSSDLAIAPPTSRTRATSRHSGSINKRRVFERQGGLISKGVLNHEYTDHGTGDFRIPSFVVLDTVNGSSITPIKYRRHKRLPGHLEMAGNSPGIRFIGDDEATTLVVTMADDGSGLEVDLIYGSIYH